MELNLFVGFVCRWRIEAAICSAVDLRLPDVMLSALDFKTSLAILEAEAG